MVALPRVQATSPKLVRSPLYIQLKQVLTELVKSDEFRVGDKFLTERQISERFDVSRATANKALSSLVSERLLAFHKGVGTFVVEDATPESSFPGAVTSFTNKTLAAGRRPSTRVLRFEHVPAESIPQHARKRFPAADGEEMIVLERLRLADDVPMILERHFFPSRLIPGVTREEVSGSVYDLLTKKYGVSFSSVDETTRTFSIRGGNAALLGVADGTPGFLMQFVPFDPRKQPCYFAEVVYRGDAYEFHNRIGPIQRHHAAGEEPADFATG
jgi:GntR family transcriptional regulator